MNEDNLEDIYELSPMQQGMLFHLQKDAGSDAYFEQFTGTLKGTINLDAFKLSWQHLIDRHTALRTAFFSEGMEEPMQVVFKEASLPFETFDWQTKSLSTSQLENELNTFLAQDRARGFSLDEAPLMRIQLIQIAPETTYLVWSFSHLLLDGWCLGLLFNEIIEHYQCIVEQKPASLPPARPYRDFIQWLSQHPAELSQSTWSDYLNGFESTTPLPFENAARSTSLTTEPDYAEQTLHLSPQLSQSLETFASTHQLTLNTLARALWALVLGYSTGKHDLVFGVTVSGRPTDLIGAESIIGMFINTVPCRIDVTQGLSTVEWLQSIQADQSRLTPHEHCPLTTLHQASALSPEQSLFDSILVFENYPAHPNESSSHPVSFQVENLKAHERTNYPLTWVVVPGDVLSFRLIFDKNRWSSESIEKLLALIESAAQQLTNASNTTLNTFKLLPPDEEETLRNWNTTNSPIHSKKDELLVPEIITKHAETHPQAIAVSHDGTDYTYQTIDQAANQLAHYLTNQGAGPETIVGICLERSAQTIIAQLAVLKTGAAFLPIDTRYPTNRITLMLEDAQVSLLLTTSDSASKRIQFSGTAVCLDTDSKNWENLSEQAPANPARPHNAAYCIYTSGSTGTPKGVIITHANLLNFVDWHNTAFNVTASSKKTHLAGSGFDASVWEIWPFLAAGASIEIVSSEVLADIYQLPTWMTQRNVTHTFLPTALFEQLADTTWPEQTSLQYVHTGGDRLMRFPKPNASIKFVNNYGPTENTIISTTGEIADPTHGEATHPSIGKVAPSIQGWILSDTLNLLPIGAIGQLYLGGPSIAREYLNRPDLTAERFIPDPFSDVSGARLYRTGDLARYLPNGEIEFIGRTDHQVQLRGHRIELHEIEKHLIDSGYCKQAAIILHSEHSEDARLVAYFVPSKSDIENQMIETHLQSLLPDYMVPSIWISLKSLPLTENGKLDRKALPSPTDHRSQSTPAYDTSLSPIEQIVADIFASVLPNDTVHPQDNFFALGGHSLMAMQVISRLREAVQCEIPLQKLFEHPTIAQLAAWLDTQQKGANHLSRPPIQASEGQETFPTSFSQERLWLLNQMPTETDPYHITLALRLEGPLEHSGLMASLNRLILRHAVLRTAFASENGQPVQRVSKNETVPIQERDLTTLSESQRMDTLKAFVHEEATKPFFLENAPLLRATAFKMSDIETALVITVHHIIVDGWSIGILARDWLACYQAATTGNDPELPALPIQYGDYAQWQRNWLQGDVLEQQLGYWQTTLKALPVLELPTDKPRPARMTHQGHTETFSLSPELTASLKSFSQEENTTLSMMLMAAYSVLLQRYSQQDDFAIGMPIANREGAETENLIGFFVNTLVIRNQYEDDTTFSELLSQIRKRSLEAYAYRDLPFEKIVEALNPDRDLSQAPLFQVMFTFQNTPELTAETGSLKMSSYPFDSGTAKFDMTLTLLETGNTLQGSLEYNRNLFHADTIQRFIEQFTHFLATITERAELTLKTIPILAPADEALLHRFNQTTTPYPEPTCLPTFLETQTLKTPDAPAVRFKDETLSYQQFNERCNQLAHHLQAKGAGSESRVAVFLERSIDMVVALHAIVKAGAAYVPIDPDYPQARIEYMLNDCQPTLIITHAKHANALNGTNVPQLHLDTIEGELTGLSTQNPPRTDNPDNLAYIIYTSGSTGNPKGAMNAHRAIYNRLQWMQATFPLDSSDRVLQKTPFSFDVSVWEFFWPFMNGACLVVAEPQQHKDSRYLAQLIEDSHITTLHFVPSMFKAFLSELTTGACQSLKRIICSGEALGYDLQELSIQKLPQAELHNLYGPTEAAVDVTHWPATVLRKADQKVPIGHAIANTQIHILDKHLNPTPIGVPGELYIGGVQLARGYWSRPELTAEKFIPDPFSETPGNRLYRTGDSVRYLENGEIEYLGRLDFQVKVRGFRVELGEIENALLAIEGIQDAVVIAREDAQGYGRLIAYLIPQEEHTIETAQLRDTLAQSLPDYMVPSLFVSLDSFPLSPNGKLDRKALPEPSETETPPQGYSAPRNPIEEVMARIWADVLGVEQVGAFSNFFELGGHSLLATQILSRVREIFRVEVTIITLFESPQLASFTEKVIQQSGNPAFIEKIANAWIKIQSMTPEEKEKLRQMKEASGSK